MVTTRWFRYPLRACSQTRRIHDTGICIRLTILVHVSGYTILVYVSGYTSPPMDAVLNPYDPRYDVDVRVVTSTYDTLSFRCYVPYMYHMRACLYYIDVTEQISFSSTSVQDTHYKVSRYIVDYNIPKHQWIGSSRLMNMTIDYDAPATTDDHVTTGMRIHTALVQYPRLLYTVHIATLHSHLYASTPDYACRTPAFALGNNTDLPRPSLTTDGAVYVNGIVVFLGRVLANNSNGYMNLRTMFERNDRSAVIRLKKCNAAQHDWITVIEHSTLTDWTGYGSCAAHASVYVSLYYHVVVMRHNHVTASDSGT